MTASPSHISSPPAPQGRHLHQAPCESAPGEQGRLPPSQASLGTQGAVAACPRSPPPPPTGVGAHIRKGPQRLRAWLTRKPAAWPPSPTPDRVAWEDKSSSHLLSCWASGRGGAGGHQEDLLSWGSAPCPCWEEEYQVAKPRGGPWDLRAPAEEWWFPRGQDPSELCPAVAFGPAQFPRDYRPPEARELGCRAPGSN